ncbi:uncharacterized protein BX664DRAFT_360743 [Halteromyces radiatus]|uniref:uncharacterized protein n=1 Tax=Halteromyces radiatus TaxID=101107 RepID=UPI00221E8679|nr:uncharacterized protein BX664DRAFT_360743 [Halteromyces radiatus]KAI8084937.1 hypothetical protein BX664DRAFT_360743 [Halteromyces radiatus]
MMDKLPVELVNKIMDELSTCDLCQLVRTNSQWYRPCISRIYESPILDDVKRHDLFFKTTKPHTQRYIRHLELTPSLITNEQLNQLTDCTGLITLHLSYCSHIVPNVLNKVLKVCLYMIQAVYLRDGQLSTETLQLLRQACHLRILDLSNTMIRPCDRIDTPHHLDTMITSTNNNNNNQMDINTLHELDLSFCNWVDDTTLMNIVHGLPHLRYIKLRWCQEISDKAIMKMIQGLKQISSIDVCHIPCMNDPARVHQLLKLNPFLETVCFTHHHYRKPTFLIRSSL